MDVEAKVRKRDPNFTHSEKTLLTLLIKKAPIIETKLTDGKSIAKKKQAWTSLTEEYNSHVNVHKVQRDTATLKRAWDNIKASAKKAHFSERSSLFRNSAGPQYKQGAIMSMVEKELELEDDPEDLSTEDDELNLRNKYPQLSNSTDNTCENLSNANILTDYFRREAIMNIKLLENKKEMEMQILQKQLEAENIRTETEEIKREAAKYLLENNKLQYEKTKLELEKLKYSGK